MSKYEVIKSCSVSENSDCSKNDQLVEVSVTGSHGPELIDNSSLVTFGYEVSAGKIIGKGRKVIWDLTDLSPGTYTITAYLDSGCGICYKTITKEVKVIECPDCN